MVAEANKVKVLVVDDEHIIANTLALILNQHGFDATAAYDGSEAVAAARRLLPDISLIDIIMAEKNGVDTAVSISQLLPKCKILLITGHTNIAELLRTARAEGHDFEVIAKPFHPEALIRKLQA